MIELPYLKNIIPNKCTSHRTAFTPSCPIETEVFQKMVDVKGKKSEPIPYELDSDGCVVIIGNSPEPNLVPSFCSEYRNAYSRVHDVDISTLPKSLPELRVLSARLGVPLLED
jgi:hypothetical protein